VDDPKKQHGSEANDGHGTHDEAEGVPNPLLRRRVR